MIDIEELRREVASAAGAQMPGESVRRWGALGRKVDGLLDEISVVQELNDEHTQEFGRHVDVFQIQCATSAELRRERDEARRSAEHYRDLHHESRSAFFINRGDVGPPAALPWEAS